MEKIEAVDYEGFLRKPVSKKELFKELIKFLPYTKPAIVINKVQLFGEEIEKAGTSSEYSPLIQWGKQIQQDAKNFDITAIQATMNNFPKIIESLRDTIGYECGF